jgi:hypothetical protein
MVSPPRNNLGLVVSRLLIILKPVTIEAATYNTNHLRLINKRRSRQTTFFISFIARNLNNLANNY